ncbi:hypothetical protein MSAN_02525800 [Mycena sanguinolenta]|uniref:Uncharacterized protein n=1 Tax=Mycena sanguinolenta TaxID=230812 RepID=A0A8H6TS57_9AGAR|nr:hypothetical protein MSAN_02525800 [Mycena sanguinolenta]
MSYFSLSHPVGPVPCAVRSSDAVRRLRNTAKQYITCLCFVLHSRFITFTYSRGRTLNPAGSHVTFLPVRAGTPRWPRAVDSSDGVRRLRHTAKRPNFESRGLTRDIFARASRNTSSASRILPAHSMPCIAPSLSI